MSVTIVISFFFFTLLVAGISWYKTRKQKMLTSTDYFLGNRSLGFFYVGGALFLTNISCNQFIGENESVYINNMTVMAWGMSSVAAMLIVSEFFMPMYLKIGAITTPDFLEVRFDTATKRIVTIIFLFSYIINLIPAVLYGGAVAFDSLFHVTELLGGNHQLAIVLLVIAICVIGSCYALLGGLKAISISDALMGLGMLIAGLLLPYYGLRYLGHGSVTEGLQTVLHSRKEHLNSIGRAADSVPFGTLFTGMLMVNLYYWGMEQFIMQQALAAKSLAAGQKGIALAGVGKIFSPLLLNIPGLIAVHLYTRLDNTASVFPRMAADVLPPVATGFMAAIVFGAALSTFNAGLNSSGTLFLMNLYKPWKQAQHKPVNEQQLVRAGKWFQIAVAFIGICIAPCIMLFKGGFYTYIQLVSSFFSIPVFAVLVVGFVTRRVPPIAAKTGMAFFVATYSLTQFVFDTGLHYLHVLAILCCITIGLMMLIGRIAPMTVPFRMEQRAVVDLQPWKQRHWFNVALLIAMVFMFVLFSHWGLAG